MKAAYVLAAQLHWDLCTYEAEPGRSPHFDPHEYAVLCRTQPWPSPSVGSPSPKAGLALVWESVEHWRGSRAGDPARRPAGAEQAPLAEARELRRCLGAAPGDEAPLRECLCRPAVQPRLQELRPLLEITDFLDTKIWHINTLTGGTNITRTGPFEPVVAMPRRLGLLLPPTPRRR